MTWYGAACSTSGPTDIKNPDRQLVAYELTTFVGRDPDLAALAPWRYPQYFDQSKRLALAMEEAADIAWTLPLPIVSRMMATVMDGLILGWFTRKT